MGIFLDPSKEAYTMTSHLPIICRVHAEREFECFTCQREITRRSEIRAMLTRLKLHAKQNETMHNSTFAPDPDAKRYAGNGTPTLPKATRQPTDYAPCICESDPISLAHYRAKQRYENAPSVDEEGNLIDVEIPDWSIEALQYVYELRARCTASIHFPHTTLDEWLSPDVHTTSDPSFAADTVEKYEYAQWIAHRSHIGQPWHERYDDDSPYVPDPSNILSDAGWDREYAEPRSVEQPVTYIDQYGIERQRQMLTVEWENGQRFTFRDDFEHAEQILEDTVVVDEVPATESVAQMGSVHWEYRRRSQGRQPWMPKATYKFVMDGERARQRQQRLRHRIAALVKELGGDPRKPEFVAWVRERGYEAAALALEARAAREGVAV